MHSVFLITGRPGCGKTSLLRQALAAYDGSAGGFFTEEIRREGERLGFRLVTLDGQAAVLAHADLRRRHRVGRYGVDVRALEAVGVAALRRAAPDTLAVIDEIGKMELLSAPFREAVLEIISRGQRVLGTILLNPHPWADGIKRQPQVRVETLTRANRRQVEEALRQWLNYRH